jgi:ABC-2 type transport system permease protein
MTVRKLFLKRVIEDWRFQWGVLHSVFDWTIQLYFLIPALIITPFVYMDVWRNIDYYWHPSIPFFVPLSIILLLSYRGNIRTYLQDADLLYLIQQNKLIYGLKLYGFFLSLVRLLVDEFIIFILSLPILFLSYGFTPMEVLWLFFSINAFRWVVLTLKKVIDRPIWKWVICSLVFVSILLLNLYTNTAVTGILGIIVDLFIIWLHTNKLLVTHRLFSREIDIERTERIKLIKFILHFSTTVEKENKLLSKKPILLFRKSKRLFQNRTKINGLTEIILKSFLRHRHYLISYFQILFITSFAIIISPIWIKWLVFILFVFFINAWSKALYKKMSSSAFFTVVPIQSDTTKEASLRFRRILIFPLILLLGIVLLSQTFS